MLHQPAFGKRLRELRLERGLSQTALGNGEISAAYLSRLESGARPPTPRVATFLATRLGVPIAAFDDHTAPNVATLLAELQSSLDPSPETTGAIGQALRDDPSVDPAVRWQALWALIESDPRMLRPDADLGPVNELATIAPHLGVPELVSRSEALYARLLRMRGRYVEAREHALAAVTASAGSSTGVADRALALLELIAVDGDDGQLADASSHAQELMRVVEGQCCGLVAKAFWANATVAYLRGDHALAAEHMAQALAKVDARDDLTLWIRLHLAASSLHLHTQPASADLARARLDELRPILRLLGEPQQLQEFEAQLAHLAYADGDVEGARQRAERLLADPDSLLTHRDTVRLETLRGRIMIATDQRSQGVAHLKALAGRTTAAALTAEVYRVLADSLADSLERLEA